MKHFLVGTVFCAWFSFLAQAQDPKVGFYDAIRADDRVVLNKLIAEYGPSKKDSRGTTPLMYAAAVGSLQEMKALIDAGADVNAKNAFDITALMWCATDPDKVRLLLANGADVNAKSKQGRTALLIAANTQGTSAIVKSLFDKGADLKKADADPVSTPLTAAADADDASVVRLLLNHGASVSEPAGGAALMMASAHGNLEVMRMLLSRGVSANAQSPPVTAKVKNGDIAIGLLTPLVLAVSYGGPDAVKLLLEHKANVNAQDVRGMTPLMLAIALDHANPQVVQLLLDHGADREIKSKAGETALDWARKFNDPAMLNFFDSGPRATNVSLQEHAANPSEALQKSVSLLDRTAATFFAEGGCSSCHAQNLTSMAMTAVRTAGLVSDEKNAKARILQTKAAWSPQEHTLMLRMDAPGGHNMASYGLLQFAADNIAPDTTSDALVHNIAAQQTVAGNWHSDGIARPPMADGDFTHTAIAIRSLTAYIIPARAAELKERIARGANWLRQATPLTTEDRNMQLLGLKWAGVNTSTLQLLAKKMIAMQRADGGWAQTAHLCSDAYATGQTLVALKEAGIPVTDEAYRRGVDFLLRTQFRDGSWHVASRAPKFQPYFQSGFPHGHDQWISMSATAWATMAVAYTLPQATPAGKSLALNR